MTSRRVVQQRNGEATTTNADVITRQADESPVPRLLSEIHTMKGPLAEQFLQTTNHLPGSPPGSILSAAGKPALHYAIRSCPAAIVPLVRAGSDVMTPDAVHHDTPLHVACFYGLLDVIVFLVQHGACVNALNSYAQTPLDKLLSLCQHPSKNSNTRLRLIIAHLLTRMGFKVNPKAQGQRVGTRSRILHSYSKAKICSDCPSLLHLSRLKVRELIQASNLEPPIRLLPVPKDLQNFLLFRDGWRDPHLTCSHVVDVTQSFRQIRSSHVI